MPKNKSVFQLVWGVLLVMAGIGVFVRVPQVMPRIEEIRYFASATIFVRLCFYLMGILLIGGGGKKIYEHCQQPDPDDTENGDLQNKSRK